MQQFRCQFAIYDGAGGLKRTSKTADRWLHFLVQKLTLVSLSGVIELSGFVKPSYSLKRMFNAHPSIFTNEEIKQALTYEQLEDDFHYTKCDEMSNVDSFSHFQVTVSDLECA